MMPFPQVERRGEDPFGDTALVAVTTVIILVWYYYKKKMIMWLKKREV